MSRPFLRLSIFRGPQTRQLRVFLAYTPAVSKNLVIKTCDTFDCGVLPALPGLLHLPKQPWYWRTRIFWNKPHTIQVVRVIRAVSTNKICALPHDDPYLLWPEAFEVWCTYARML